MTFITKHSLSRAFDDAVKLWSLSSTQYPKQQTLILDSAAVLVIDTVSSFALNARRSMELFTNKEKFQLKQSRFNWEPSNSGVKVNDLRDAFDRVIHAKQLKVGFELLPKKDSVIVDSDAVIIPYIQAETDRKPLEFIDTFALSHAFLYHAYPLLVKKISERTR
jgi:hypothetical protein